MVTRDDITPALLADWRGSGTRYLTIAAGLIEQIQAGALSGEVPSTEDLAKEHRCLTGDVVTAKILLAQLGFLAADRHGFHLPEDVKWATAPEDVTYAGATEDLSWAAGQEDATFTVVPGDADSGGR